MNLVPDTILERSAVVANCNMNRERDFHGSNGYEVELGLCPFKYLKNTSGRPSIVRWLDLCCGTGTALIQVGQHVAAEELPIKILGVDLVGMFSPNPVDDVVTLVEASLSQWEPELAVDLITCVHGLHYIGDKLGLLSRAANWLTPNGLLVANLSMENIHVETHTSRVVTASLRHAGFHYCSTKKRLQLEGQQTPQFPFQYLGSDDQAGPNYTGQPAVNSHYRRIEGS